MSNKNHCIYKTTYICGKESRTAEVWHYPDSEEYAILMGSGIFWFNKDQKAEAIKKADALVKGKT